MSTTTRKGPVVIFLSLLMLTAILSGCTGLLGNDTDPEPDPEPELADWNVYYVESGSDLPACGSSTLGRLYYVESNNAFEVCTNAGWSFVDITGEDGIPGVDGLAGMDGKSAIVELIAESAGANCEGGGTLAQSGTDTDGDGTLDSDEVTQQAFICSGSPGLDGADGSDGVQGVPGIDGTDGIDGSNGLNSLVNTLQEGAGANCAAGGLRITSGIDLDSNGNLEPAEEEITSYVCNGVDGSNGQGLNSLIEVIPTSGTSSSCALTGQQISTGIDANSDGVLQQNEVSTVVEICDGVPGPIGATGAPGTNGTNGQDGLHGNNSLLNVVDESAGVNCANGGVKVEAGVDDNGDGQLTGMEIDQTRYICNGGSSINSMLMTQGTPPASQCDEGRYIATGLDDGGGGGIAANGVLESGEVDSNTTWCRNWIAEKISNSGFDFYDFAGKLIFTTGDYAYDELHYLNPESGETGIIYDPSYYTYDFDFIEFNGNLHVITQMCYYSFYYYYSFWEYKKFDSSLNGETLLTSSGRFYGSSHCGMDRYHGGFVKYNDALYFEWYNSSGFELWKYTDGNDPSMLIDINAGSSGSDSSYPSSMHVFDGALYFSANNSGNGQELWKSYGTSGTTSMLKNLNSNGSGDPRNFAEFNGELYFSAVSDSEGRELWKTNGTESGTIMLIDIRSGSNSSSPWGFTEFNGELFFQAYDDTYGEEMWKTNGTAAGTVLVKDINLNGNANPSGFTEYEGTLYFFARTTSGGYYYYYLYKTDGTQGGTTSVDYVGSSPPCGDLMLFEGELYYEGEGWGSGYELYVFDGTSVRVAYDFRAGSSYPCTKIVHGGYLYVTAQDDTSTRFTYRVSVSEEVSFQ